MQQVVNEVRRQVEKEKEIAIAETKRKKWVRCRHTPVPGSVRISLPIGMMLMGWCTCT
jgi:hypothetical protein